MWNVLLNENGCDVSIKPFVNHINTEWKKPFSIAFFGVPTTNVAYGINDKMWQSLFSAIGVDVFIFPSKFNKRNAFCVMRVIRSSSHSFVSIYMSQPEQVSLGNPIPINSSIRLRAVDLTSTANPIPSCNSIGRTNIMIMSPLLICRKQYNTNWLLILRPVACVGKDFEHKLPLHPKGFKIAHPELLSSIRTR